MSAKKILQAIADGKTTNAKHAIEVTQKTRGLIIHCQTAEDYDRLKRKHEGNSMAIVTGPADEVSDTVM